MRDVFKIDDVDTLKLLVKPTSVEIVEALDRPRSATDIAAHMGVPRTRLYHHLHQLTAKNLIQVASSRQVGAITERLYQVVARKYQPSARLLASSEFGEQVEAVLTTLLDGTRTELSRALVSKVASLDRRTRPRTTSLARTRLRLSPEAAGGFVRELEELIERMEAAEADDGSSYAFVFTFYPIPGRVP
ncbi:MAG: helix-turn-helix domain-containing protein [Actinomycetota bacterium]